MIIKKKYNILYSIIDFFFQNSFIFSICRIINDYKPNQKIIIFDVGCYVGNFSREIKKKISKKLKATYYLFDPNPYLKLKDFNYYCVGISNEVTKKRFNYNTYFPSSGSGFSNITRDDLLWNLSRKLITFDLFKKFKQFTVRTNTLDNFCHQKKIFRIDVLKIDTEGHELEVLNGAKKILNKTKIIQIEIMGKKNLFKKKFIKVNDYLQRYKFKLLKKKRQLLASFLSNIKIIDCLYIRN